VRILIGWDNESQAELISLYLNASDNEVIVASDRAGILAAAKTGRYLDAILMTTSLPGMDEAYEIFQALRSVVPDCPIVGACYAPDVFRMARFLTCGMRSYVLRDDGADFVFLLQATLENTVASVRAEREQKISERLREEIESVRKMQESIIPQDLVSPPGYQICARYEPSQMRVMGGRPVLMAGGDYYDVFSLDDQSIVVLVGDASGHGMKACMSIMTMHTLVRMIRNHAYQEPAAFVTEVNRRLCEQAIISNEGGFITLMYGILRSDRNEFQWSCAGHPPPIAHNLITGTVEPLGSDDSGGLPLGIYADAEYETHSAPVALHSRLLLYTDGLLEAFPENAEGHQEFGMHGVRETMRKCTASPLNDALQALFDDTHAFTQGSGRHDDTSVVLLERT
jgi:serine phosphatase RsbU (regulator of sigma subunit)